MAQSTLLVLCGGRSAEHEVSLQSALNIVAAVDRSRYRLLLVGIDRNGDWRLLDPDAFAENPDDPSTTRLAEGGTAVTLACRKGGGCLVPLDGGDCIDVDVAFPVLHGPYGEDGTLQGMLSMLNIPYVGCDHASSANCMDKAIAKELLQVASLPVAASLLVRRQQPCSAAQIEEQLGWPVFVKPARLGSSVGISKVMDADGLTPALDLALRYDDRVLVERHVSGREIECAVLGNDEPRASVPGEIIPAHDFYSYEAKYLDAEGARLEAPADLEEEDVLRIQRLAVRAFNALGCSGMARVDFFLGTEGALTVNEINTIPGFTRISMYPRLWHLDGMPYPALVDELIRLALERHEAAEQRVSARD